MMDMGFAALIIIIVVIINSINFVPRTHIHTHSQAQNTLWLSSYFDKTLHYFIFQSTSGASVEQCV